MIGGKESRLARKKINEQRKLGGSKKRFSRCKSPGSPSLAEIPLDDDPSDLVLQPHPSSNSGSTLTSGISLPDKVKKKKVHREQSPVPVCDPVRDLVNDVFLLEVDDISVEKMEKVWDHFAEGETSLDDDSLERLLIEFLILVRAAAQRQITRQQQAVKHCEKRAFNRNDTALNVTEPTSKDLVKLTELKQTVHEKYPAVGGNELSKEAGEAAVKCNKIIARIRRGASFLHPFKSILNPACEEVRKKHFMRNFPHLVENLSTATNLETLCQIAPIRSASSGANLNWRPDALSVGPVGVKCEFEFEDIENVPEEEKFNIPENTTLKEFINHLCKIYEGIEEYKEELDIQIVTPDSLEPAEWDSDLLLHDGMNLVFMD